MQRKEHVFQALTLEKTWDLNKKCTIVILDEISISMGKSNNDMHTNKKAIQSVVGLSGYGGARIHVCGYLYFIVYVITPPIATLITLFRD